MNPLVVFYNFLVRLISPLLVFVARRWRNRFYLYLAAAFSLLIALDAMYLHTMERMQHGAFDIMMRSRLIVPSPDPDIVIVDIDEASLAAMAGEYGRWPWPRQVLGEFVELLEAQGPQAIVFDILFSDPDVFNPDSDAYFDAAIAVTRNTYFPMLRLDPSSDALSAVRPAMIPGVEPIPDAARAEATIAVVLPHFPSILSGGRLGLHNIYPDGDGVARAYPVYRHDYGWRVPSLPARVVADLGVAVPAVPSVLLNWRGPPFSYQTVSFAPLFNDMLSRERQRPADEFSGKIVLIGSTAPSLFDIKPTPMARLHPGVEIMATAIDNLKHDDYLRFPQGRVVYPLLTMAIIWVIALAIVRDPEGGNIDRVVGMFEFVLLTSSYASINLSHTYINLTGTFTAVLGFYAVARLYSVATRRVLEANTLRDSAEREGELGAFLLLIRADDSAGMNPHRTIDNLRRGLATLGTGQRGVDLISGRQKGVWSVLEHTLAVSWIFAAADADARLHALQDIDRIVAWVEHTARAGADGTSLGAQCYAHEGTIAGGEAALEDWRTLLAETQLLWRKDLSRLRNAAS